MQDPFEQLDKEFSQKVLSKFQREENYVPKGRKLR